MKFIALLFLLTIIACNTIPYVSDAGLMSSASANSPELMVLVNGKICKNGGGEIGLCIERVVRGKDITLHLDALPYSYHLDLQCTQAISSDESFDVESDKPWDHAIKHDNFDSSTVFNCTISVTPVDRGVGIFAAMRIFIVSDKYVPLEKIYKNQEGKLVLGQHAYISIADNKTRYYSTVIDSAVKVLVESAGGRRAYYGQ